MSSPWTENHSNERRLLLLVLLLALLTTFGAARLFTTPGEPATAAETE